MYIEIVKQIKYKESWILSQYPTYSGKVHTFRWSWMAEDSTGEKWSGKQRIYGGGFHLDEAMTQPEVLRRCLTEALKCEVHESMEYFKWNNRTVFDPHAESGFGMQADFSKALDNSVPQPTVKFHDTEFFKYMASLQRRKDARYAK